MDIRIPLLATNSNILSQYHKENLPATRLREVHHTMWTEVLCAVLAALILTYYKIWRNISKYNGNGAILPPGSTGLPFIGETIQLIIPSYSLDIHPFFKNRLQKYGPIFKTSVAGYNVVVSADPEVNEYIFQQEGKSVHSWFIDEIPKTFHEGHGGQHFVDSFHRYSRSLVLNSIGLDRIKQNMIPQFEDEVAKALHHWSDLESIEVRHAVSDLVFSFTAKHTFGYDHNERAEEKLGDMVVRMFDGLVSFPLNIPGAAFHKSLKEGKKAYEVVKRVVEERRKSAENPGSDIVGQAVKDMGTKGFLTEDLVTLSLLGVTLAAVETISVALALTIKFISDHPAVIHQLEVEHEEILNKRAESNSSLSWEEYKSMNYTQQVINEVLRFGTIIPGLLRKTSKDIHVKGYTIPAGWTFMAVTSAIHFNPDIYTDPFVFNPARWKDMEPYTISKNFMPFGGGRKQCTGAEYAKAFVATFLHVLVTNYRWTKIKEKGIARRPILVFEDGIHIKLWKKHERN